MATDFIFLNHKQALIDLCLRNALKYAMGEVRLTMDLQNQLEFAYSESNQKTKDLLDTIFQIKHDIEKGLLD